MGLLCLEYEMPGCRVFAKLCSSASPDIGFVASKYTKEQKEGLARFIDAVAAAALIGGVVGLTGHSPLSVWEIVTLFVACPILLLLPWRLRSPT